MLFDMNTSLHKNDGVTEWAPPNPGSPYDSIFWEMYPEGRPATLFEHPWFRDSDQYPNGAADMAGYWAEARILGGVVLFDRRPNGEPDHVYLHPNREDATYRIFRLLPEQKQNLVEFLTTEADSPTNPLPIMGTKTI